MQRRLVCLSSRREVSVLSQGNIGLSPNMEEESIEVHAHVIAMCMHHMSMLHLLPITLPLPLPPLSCSLLEQLD